MPANKIKVLQCFAIAGTNHSETAQMAEECMRVSEG